MQQDQRIAQRERRRATRRRAIPLVLAVVGLVAIPLVMVALLNTELYTTTPTILIPFSFAYMSLAPGFLIGLLILTWIVALIILSVDGRRWLAHRRRQARLACPNCGQRDAPPAVAFQRKVAPGTGWEELTCPHCHKVWHIRL